MARIKQYDVDYVGHGSWDSFVKLRGRIITEAPVVWDVDRESESLLTWRKTKRDALHLLKEVKTFPVAVCYKPPDFENIRESSSDNIYRLLTVTAVEISDKSRTRSDLYPDAHAVTCKIEREGL
jgi:hypothetical protein